MKNLIKLISAMAFVVCSTNVHAGLISTPMDLNDSHVVGIIDTTGVGGGPISGGAAAEKVAAQALLDLTVGGSTTIDFNEYLANTLIDFSDTLTDYYKPEDSFFNTINTTSLTVTGYDYAMGKYDGPNAGYILFDLTDAASHVLPEFPANFWTTSDQYQLSHWVAFNGTNGGNGGDVPEPGSLALLGIGLLGFALARRRRYK